LARTFSGVGSGAAFMSNDENTLQSSNVEMKDERS